MHVSAGVNSSFVAKVLYLRAETPRQGGETVRNLIQTSLYGFTIGDLNINQCLNHNKFGTVD